MNEIYIAYCPPTCVSHRWGPQPKSPEQRRRPVDGWVFEPDVPSAPASYPLPHLDRINFEDERCLSAHQVFWPGDGQCYDLLQRGPCSRDDHWLVLKQKPRSAEVEVVCQKRPCPCNPRDPTLCEVWYEGEAGPCGSHCRVALAAEQDGVCGQGEQLRLTPFGTGVCECRDGHERWGRDQVGYTANFLRFFFRTNQSFHYRNATSCTPPGPAA